VTDRGAAQADGEAGFDDYVRAHPLATYLQTGAWSQVKAKTGWSSTFVRAQPRGGGNVAGRLLTRPIPMLPWQFAYCPRGPLGDGQLEDQLRAWTGALRAARQAAGPLAQTALVRMDPEIEQAVAREQGTEATLRRLGWRRAHDMQPRRTRIVDLTADEEALWSDLRKKWRQYVNKARSNGIIIREVDPAVEKDAFERFHAVLRDVGERTAVPLRSAQALHDVWAAFAPAGECRVLFADDAAGGTQAVLLLVRCGTRVAEPYGGMTLPGAESRANYLLKWEAMRMSREQGATSYDMWGLIGSGIDFFKAGFGGREVTYIGAWDLPLAAPGSVAFRIGERARQLYRAGRRLLRGEKLTLPTGPAGDA
jgi:lipid II:glycine glycyltransferase (peptidoglycan interpeptide bridge formation enzyme)